MAQIADGGPAEIKILEVAGDHLDVLIPLTDAEGADVALSGWTVEADAVGAQGGGVTALSAAIVGSAVRLQATPAQTAAMEAFSLYDIRLTSADEAQRVTAVAGVIQILPAQTTPD